VNAALLAALALGALKAPKEGLRIELLRFLPAATDVARDWSCAKQQRYEREPNLEPPRTDR
jgi:hypothetical protein